MNNREPEPDFSEPTSFEGRDSDPLTTADMAAASVPARAPDKAQAKAPAKAEDTGENAGAEFTAAEPSEEGNGGFEPLFDEREGAEFRSRWFAIQAGFVDEPRNSVEEADELVAAAIKRLAEIFAAERKNLEEEWGSGDDVSTEDLRVALRRYRSFFDRLLSV